MKNYKITKKLFALLLSVLVVFSAVSVSAVETESKECECDNVVYAGTVESVSVTCTTDGYEKNKCGKCDKTYEVIIPSTGHEFDEENGWVEIQAPEHNSSRIQKGKMENKCLNCNFKKYKDIPSAHEFDDNIPQIVHSKATCVKKGSVSKYCVLCKKYVDFLTKDVDKNNHTLGDEVHIIDSESFSCQKDGKGIKVCVDCNAVVNVTVPKSEYHKYLKWEVERNLPADATCENGKSGLLVKKCNFCDSYKEEKEFYADHIFEGATKGLTPTCTELGYERGICQVCSADDEELVAVENVLFIDSANHSWLPEVEYSAATCTTNGRNIKRCKYNINHIEFVTVEAGHVFDTEWTVVEPTCKDNGYRQNTCSRCETVVTETITNENIEHDFDLLKVKVNKTEDEIDCTGLGVGEIWCDVCEAYIETTLPDHSATMFIAEITPATCINVGELKYACKKCSHTYSKVLPIDPDAHNPGLDDITVKEPTCCEDGIKAKKCRRCGNADMSTKVPVKKTNKHIVGDWEVTAATCTKDGVKVRKCTTLDKCKFSESVALAKSHNFTSWSYEPSLENATCETPVTRIRFCRNSDCPIKYEQEPIYGGHVFGGYRFIGSATCTTGGTAMAMCEVCEKPYATEEVAPGEHIIDYSKVEGYLVPDENICIGKTYKCSVCDAEVEDIKKHEYYLITPEVPATCEEKGSTAEYACKNCNRHVESEDIRAIGHKYVWGEKGTVRCVNCGLFESVGGSACGHFCHNKTTMAKILTKVFSFFWKIFGSNHFCADCGDPHYHIEDTTIISKEVNEKGKLVITYSCEKCKVEKEEVVLK